MSRRAREKNTLKTVSSTEESLIKSQLKTMDIGPPVIDLYARVSDTQREEHTLTSQENAESQLSAPQIPELSIFSKTRQYSLVERNTFSPVTS